MTWGRPSGAFIPNSKIKAPDGYIVAGHGKIVKPEHRTLIKNHRHINELWTGPLPRSECKGGVKRYLVGHTLMSPRQRDVYLYVRYFWRFYGYSPSYKDIAFGLKLKTHQSAMEVVHRLVEMGLLLHEPLRKRDIRPAGVRYDRLVEGRMANKK